MASKSEAQVSLTQQPSQSAAAGRQHNHNRTFSVIASDLSAVAFPLAFLALIANLYALRDTAVNQTALTAWRNAIIVFASAYPIFFAVIIGRLTYQIARWSLERGVSVGFLEQMMGSRTFGGAIITQYSLGIINLVGVGLVLLWALSPLGSQALLRIFDTRLVETTVTRDVTFQQTTMTTGLSDRNKDDHDTASWFHVLGITFCSLLYLTEDMQTAAMDHWGNIRVPFLKSDRFNKETAGIGKIPYSALAGIQLTDIPVGNTTFNIESGYIDLNCKVKRSDSSVDRDPDPDTIKWDWPDPRIAEYLEKEDPPRNGTWQGIQKPNGPKYVDGELVIGETWQIALDRFVDEVWQGEPYEIDNPGMLAAQKGIEAGPTRLLFDGQLTNSGFDAVTAHCDVRQRYVESEINCERVAATDRHNCTVTRQRPSRGEHAPETISHLSFPQIFHKISLHLPQATNVKYWWRELFLQYLSDPEKMRGSPFRSTSVFNYLDIDEFKFSRRLSQLLNTYILVASHGLQGEDDEGQQDNPLILVRNPVTATTTGTVSTLHEVYTISIPWIVLGLVAGVILLLGGIASIVFTHLASGPEVLGFASSAMRDSRFMDMPAEMGHISSMDISKAISKVRVRYGYSLLTREGEPLVGVGPEAEMERIKGRKS